MNYTGTDWTRAQFESLDSSLVQPAACWRVQRQLFGGLRFVVAMLLCDHLESEVWVSEGRLELESKELQEEKDWFVNYHYDPLSSALLHQHLVF